MKVPGNLLGTFVVVLDQTKPKVRLRANEVSEKLRMKSENPVECAKLFLDTALFLPHRKPMDDQNMQGQPEQMNQPATPESGYAKKGSWGKWLLIYLVIAVVVYGLIWYFFLRDTGTGSIY